MDPRVIRVGNELGGRSRALEDLRLGVRDRLDRLEEGRVNSRHVGPDPKFGLGDLDERADLSSVIHPKLDDGNLRPVSELQQG